MSESIESITPKKTDFVNITGNIFCNINYKLSIFMFLFGILLFSDLFIETFLIKIPGAVDGENTTTKGTIIQLLVFCLVLIILDLLIKYKWI